MSEVLGLFGVCGGESIGVSTIACFNAATGFILGWALLVMFALILWRNVELEPIKDRVAVVSFVSSIWSFILVGAGFLSSDMVVGVFAVAIGSAALLVFRRA